MKQPSPNRQRLHNRRKARRANINRNHEDKLQFSPIQCNSKNVLTNSEDCKILIPKDGTLQGISISIGNPSESLRGVGVSVLWQRPGFSQNAVRSCKAPGIVKINSLNWKVKAGDTITAQVAADKETVIDELIMSASLGVKI